MLRPVPYPKPQKLISRLKNDRIRSSSLHRSRERIFDTECHPSYQWYQRMDENNQNWYCWKANYTKITFQKFFLRTQTLFRDAFMLRRNPLPGTKKEKYVGKGKLLKRFICISNFLCKKRWEKICDHESSERMKE